MPNWNAATWGIVVGVVGAVATLASVVVAWLAWRKPRQVESPRQAHERVAVEVSNHFPVFDLPDGTRRIGDHLIGVTLRNGSDRAVNVTSWGVRLPGNRHLVVTRPTVPWEPRLPHWVQPGDAATWYVDAAGLREQASELAIEFKDMRGYVSLADGRRIDSDSAVPLS